MSKELSPRGATTGNTNTDYTDLGATTREAYEISARSRALARSEIGDRTPEDRIRQRCSVAVGDFSMAGLIRFAGKDPVGAGIRAIAGDALIVTDIRMVQVGIQKKGHHCAIVCALDHAGSGGEITRSSAGFLALRDQLADAVVVIGNAPSALLTVCEIVRGGTMPALVVGTPVGFVNAAESKEALRAIPVPSISTEGTRGGTPVAVAAINEIITMVAEESGYAAGTGR